MAEKKKSTIAEQAVADVKSNTEALGKAAATEKTSKKGNAPRSGGAVKSGAKGSSSKKAASRSVDSNKTSRTGKAKTNSKNAGTKGKGKSAPTLLPETQEAPIFDLIADIDEAEAARIESEAIAALPVAEVEPELLIYDDGEIEDTHETAEEAAIYEDYLRDYKETMATMLKNAKARCEDSEEPHPEDAPERAEPEAQAAQDDALSDDEEDIISAPTAEPEDKPEAQAEIGEPLEYTAEVAEDEPIEVDDEGEKLSAEDISDAVELEFGTEISRERRNEGFDPLSTISLVEYVPSLLGEEDAEQTEDENLPDVDSAQNIEEAEELTEEQLWEYDSEVEYEEDEEYGEPEQLTMSFGNGGGEDEEPDKHSYNPKKPRSIDSLFDLIELFVLTFVAIMFVTTFFFRHSVIDGRSMEGTLYDGDVVIISDFLYTPERGDIVVLDDRDAHEGALVKRVIGIEGDLVSIRRDGTVYVNGRQLREDYVYESDPSHIYNEKTWRVGEGEIFVLGDHRDISDDSENFGPVKADAVLGKVLFRLLPFSSFGGVD